MAYQAKYAACSFTNVQISWEICTELVCLSRRSEITFEQTNNTRHVSKTEGARLEKRNEKM